VCVCTDDFSKPDTKNNSCHFVGIDGTFFTNALRLLAHFLVGFKKSDQKIEHNFFFQLKRKKVYLKKEE